jgi:copper chaperone CopZ
MSSGATRIVLLLTGMRNNSCRERIADVLGRVKGVKDVNVNLIRARAVVVCEATCSAAVLVDAVVAAGYGATVNGQ